MWMIPKKTKVELEIFKNVTIIDVLLGFFALGVIAFLVASNIPGKFIIAGVLLVVTVGLLYRIDGEPNYQFLFHILFHMMMPAHYRSALGEKNEKAHRVEDIMSVTDIREDVLVYGNQYYGAVLEIPPVDYRFFTENRKLNAINSLGKVVRYASGEYCMNIVKIDRPIHYDTMRASEEEKLQRLRLAFENGELTEKEFQCRVEVVYDRLNEIDDLNEYDKVIAPSYYVVLHDSDIKQLDNQVRNAIETLAGGEMKPKRLDAKELALFLRYCNELDFDEAELDDIEPEEYAHWSMPKSIDFKVGSTRVDGMICHTLHVINYPIVARDAWLATVLSLPGIKCVMKCKALDRAKAVRNIDHSLLELRGQYSTSGQDSKRLEIQSHIETLEQLLVTLQNDNENLMSTNIYITIYDAVTAEKILGEAAVQNSYRPRVENMKRMVKRTFAEQNIRLGGLDFQQQKAFVGSQVSGYDPFTRSGRGIPGNTIGAGFPWVFASVCDEKGICLGSSDGIPVFMDFFRRDSERVNSNMVIVGKSGSGKSYAVKSILTNLAADDAKIFVLDPENEYTELAGNLHGQFINVGNASSGRLNPFHIMTALEDEQDGASLSGSYEMHLQFLEEFFRQILPDCDHDAMEYLNAIVDRMYMNKGITIDTDLSMLRPSDYPLFDNLYDEILQEFQQTDNEYIRSLLRTLMNYISKFSTGGRNSGIWNGYSTVTTEENFSVFNFQSLLSNRNGTIANAQMLLVLKYIDNEIIKNREYNRKNHANRKIVVVIDEAHVFIDAKYPIALDFMAQLAKRIRKYNGMQIVITQNIKDFVGTEEIAAKSGAIINACQYSLIFSLAPNDMDDLCKLYEKSGGINESEREQIVSAPRGNTFAVLGPTTRTSFRIEVPSDVQEMFEQPEYITKYFANEDGLATWMDFVGGSYELHDAAIEKKRKNREIEQEQRKPASKVVFETVQEDELENEEPDVATSSAKKKAGKGITLETVQLVEEEESPKAAASVAPTATAGTADSKTQELLAELLLRLGNDALSHQISEAVSKEMERRNLSAVAAVSDDMEDEDLDSLDLEDDDESIDFLGLSDLDDDLFGSDLDEDSLSDDEDDTDDDEGDDEDRSDSSYSASDEPDSDDDDEEDDFWKRLRDEFEGTSTETDRNFDVASYVEEQSNDEEAIEKVQRILSGEETIMEISLKELTTLVKMQKKRAQS